jgi:hypothetical protein
VVDAFVTAIAEAAKTHPDAIRGGNMGAAMRGILNENDMRVIVRRRAAPFSEFHDEPHDLMPLTAPTHVALIW